jgi:eukaryotic-like serine/threonine-protein kinase
MEHRPLLSGTLLSNRYRIERLIKAGGFAAVYVAVDLRQRKLCAVKETFDPSPDGAEQFRLEADILSRVRHPNLPPVWDYFQDNGGLYLVMEYIEGDDLESWLDDEGCLGEDRVREIGLQLCEALSSLHMQQPPIIHRDIKPANIKITPDSRTVLVDFGIAKLYRAGNNTQVAARAVTDGFSPLEQYGQGSTDPRSDIYALGATLYNLLTGLIPPDAPSRVDAETLVAPSHIRNTITPTMEQIVLRALQVRASDRYQSAEEMYRALVDAERQARISRYGANARQAAATGSLNQAGWRCAFCQTRNPIGSNFCLKCNNPSPLYDADAPTRIIPTNSSPLPPLPPLPLPLPPSPALSGPLPGTRTSSSPVFLHPPVERPWEVMAGPPGGVLLSISGRPGQMLVACGERGLVLVHNNDTWMPLPPATSYTLYAVSGVSGHIWAVGEYGTVVHFANGRWSVIQGEVVETLHTIALDSSVSGWIASTSGSLIDLRDLMLAPIPLRRGHVRALAIDDVGDGWAVGDNSLILRLTQGTWKPTTTSMDWGNLYGVDHREPGEAWAVGANGLLLRINDFGWQEGPVLRLPDLHGIAFNRRGEGWAVGENGSFAWFNRDAWTLPSVASPTPITLRSVAWLHDDEAWAVGDHGIVLRWRR